MAERTLGPADFLVAGILNVTPDSFYDGGRHDSHQAALSHGLKLLEQGADILDIGGESTRPGAATTPEEVEQSRVVPLVRDLSAALKRQKPEAAVSVDTYKAGVADAALEAGAEIINDVSACRFDPGLVDVLVQRKPGYVLMHSQGKPATMQQAPVYENVVEEIIAFFEQRLTMLVTAGLPEDRIVLDPGVGFGKTFEHNLEILRRIERFADLGRPLYMGLSRKSVWRNLLGLTPDESLVPTCTATALLAARGVFIHRVHDPGPARQAVLTAMALENKPVESR
jgi:dihydropteroate synthase